VLNQLTNALFSVGSDERVPLFQPEIHIESFSFCSERMLCL